ncbi:Hypothetical predicted protein [Mytilus galloprovincialis]|uniref:Sushi domain-containing protein n=1 Tax=Mytilus galloprovincialis TaxID=29158 RepID=A0A8B6GTM2_MYTGA|nr:Hypothetical predicted protein [Mytilus galloprovincialis]
MKKFKDFLQRNNDFGHSGARCKGEANLLINQNFANCKVIKCTAPGLNEFTTTSTNTDVVPNTEVTYTCEFGYQLPAGDLGTRICQLGGTWPAPPPACEVMKCTAPGINEFTITSTNTDVVPSTEVTYTCKFGYQLPAGDLGTRICQFGGTWPAPPPACEGIMNAVVIILVSCGAGILPFFCIVYCCAHKKGKRANINQNVNNHGNNADRNEEISQNMLTEKESDEEYAEIDELEVSDLIVSPLEQRYFTDSDSSSENASDEIKLSSFGYSHPTLLHRDEEISQNMLTEKESDEEYAEIDELEVSDLIVSPLEQRCFTDSDSSSDNASDEIKLSSFGYSHPTLLPAPQQSGNVQGDSDAC